VSQYHVGLYTAPSLDRLANRTYHDLERGRVVAPGVGYWVPASDDLVYVWEVQILGEAAVHSYTLDVCATLLPCMGPAYVCECACRHAEPSVLRARLCGCYLWNCVECGCGNGPV
jgi:hypothetical protein